MTISHIHDDFKDKDNQDEDLDFEDFDDVSDDHDASFDDDDDDDHEIDEMDEANFDDYDSTQKGSLREVWETNPLLKLAIIGLVLLVVIVGIFLFRGPEESKTSTVKSASDKKELVLGQELTQDRKERIDEDNETNLQIAEQQQTSFIPISTEQISDKNSGAEIDVTPDAENPLSIWRENRRNKFLEDSKKIEEAPEVLPEPVVIPQQPVVQQPVILRPNPEQVAAIGNGMLAQMEQILGSQQINAPRHMIVTSTSLLDNGGDGNGDGSDNGNDGGSDGGAGSDNSEASGNTLVSAGTISYAQTLIEANTDAPGPVLAQILSGPLRGARIMGSFSETDNFLTMTFNQVILNGESIGVNAIALDANTTLPGVVTDIDRRYFTRVILPAAAAFIEGFGSAVADTGSTNVSVNGETVTTSEDDLDTREELLKGVEEASSVVADFMDEEASRTRVMIKVARGTPVGILFIDPVQEGGSNSVAADTSNFNQ